MFIGDYPRTIDPKGRLVLPPSFRNLLAGGAVVAPLDFCLGILPVSEFERMVLKLEEDVNEGIVHINALRCLAGTADQVVPDAQGRVRIVPRLRKIADIDKDVVVVGNITRVELWNPESWDEIVEGNEELAQAITSGRGIGRASLAENTA